MDRARLGMRICVRFLRNRGIVSLRNFQPAFSDFPEATRTPRMPLGVLRYAAGVSENCFSQLGRLTNERNRISAFLRKRLGFEFRFAHRVPGEVGEGHIPGGVEVHPAFGVAIGALGVEGIHLRPGRGGQ